MKVLLASDCSDQAFEAAAFLASLRIDTQFELTIVTALGDPYSTNPASTGRWFPELVEQERQRAEEHQESIAKQMSRRCHSIDKICQSGHPVKVILEKAAELDCDLIVMGARGHSLIDRLLIGSVSDSVATHAKCSVLVVRPHQDNSPEDRIDGPNHLVIGYDSSLASREAVDEILSLGWHPSTRIELVSVAPIYDYLLGNGLSPAAIANEEEIFNEMKRGSEEIKQRIDDSLSNTSTVVIQDQRVGDALVDVAKKHRSDLVVVGDSGHSLLDDFLLGSTTKYVLRHAETSVWISRHHRSE